MFCELYNPCKHIYCIYIYIIISMSNWNSSNSVLLCTMKAPSIQGYTPPLIYLVCFLHNSSAGGSRSSFNCTATVKEIQRSSRRLPEPSGACCSQAGYNTRLPTSTCTFCSSPHPSFLRKASGTSAIPAGVRGSCR